MLIIKPAEMRIYGVGGMINKIKKNATLIIGMKEIIRMVRRPGCLTGHGCATGSTFTEII